MTTALILTERDNELLYALVQKFRLVSLRQSAQHWWNGDISNARRRLRILSQAGLIHRLETQARPIPELHQPTVVWRPGDPAPNFDSASYIFQNRWRSSPIRNCTVFIATEQFSRQLGGRHRGELKHPMQATHDLGVAQIWLHLHRHEPELANAWRSEDLLAHTRRGEKCPDAFIVDQSEKVIAVVEFGGAYHAERIREFHHDCSIRSLPYQIW
jgi:hypothetical protein